MTDPDENATMARGPWIALLASAYEEVITGFEKALRRCPKELWTASMWPVRKEDPFIWPPGPIEGSWTRDLGAAEASIQYGSAFCAIAYHTLFHLDYNLSGAVPIIPPEPFSEDDELPAAWRADDSPPRRVYTCDELLAYTEYCRDKARAIFANLTDEAALNVLATPSRRAGLAYKDLLFGHLRHVVEHASQMKMYLSQNGVDTNGPVPGAWSAINPTQLLQAATAGETLVTQPIFLGWGMFPETERRYQVLRARAVTERFEVWTYVVLGDQSEEAFANALDVERLGVRALEGLGNRAFVTVGADRAELRVLSNGAVIAFEARPRTGAQPEATPDILEKAEELLIEMAQRTLSTRATSPHGGG